MYEKLIRRLKRIYIALLVFLLLILAYVVYALIRTGPFILPILIVAAVLGIFIYFIFIAYRNIDKNAKLLQDALNIQSDAEFNELLEQSERLAEYVFLSKTHLISVNKFLSFELKKIGYLEKTCHSDEDSTTYCIAVSDGNGIKEIDFPNEKKRNAAFNTINTALGNGVGDKRLW